MSELTIGVIAGSTRPGRKSRVVAEWVVQQASIRPEASYELIDLVDHRLPLLDESAPPSLGKYQHEHTQHWAATIDRLDGFIFVSPEYNHSTSAVLKNAMDFLYGEWNDKAAAFVAYGSMGGTRAIEHLRGVASELQIAHIRAQLSFSLSTDFENNREFTPGPQHLDTAQVLFGQLEAWAGALKTVRAAAI